MKPEPPKPPPTGCIRATGSSNTVCQRGPGSDEFVFQDGDHAIAHYKTSKTFRVCEECARLYEAKQKAVRAGLPESSAIRGLGNHWGSG